MVSTLYDFLRQIIRMNKYPQGVEIIEKDKGKTRLKFKGMEVNIYHPEGKIYSLVVKGIDPIIWINFTEKMMKTIMEV